jgi:hypothetical protein
MPGLAKAQNRRPFSNIENAFAKFQTPGNQTREMARKASSKPSDSTANLGFEAKLWLAADTATRGSAKRNRAAIWRDLRAAQDHRSNPFSSAA